jgi:tRNA dimethylallyltransferase
MVAAGLVAEVSRLREMGYNRNLVSMQGIGYKEIYAYLEGETTLEAAIDLIKLETRHFAKRQLTWFRREKDVDWVDLPKYNYEKEEILAYMYGQIKELVNENNL